MWVAAASVVYPSQGHCCTHKKMGKERKVDLIVQQRGICDRIFLTTGGKGSYCLLGFVVKVENRDDGGNAGLLNLLFF